MISALIAWGFGFGGILYTATHGLGSYAASVFKPSHFRRMLDEPRMNKTGFMLGAEGMRKTGPVTLLPVKGMVKE